MIDSPTNATQLAFFPGSFLEGAITVANDVARYGPWAGTILAAAERDNAVYSVNTNGFSRKFPQRIVLEDIHVVPTNQDYYVNDFGNGQVLKLPRQWLTNYVGDMLVTTEGSAGAIAPELYILHWDPTSTNFVKHWLVGPRSSQFEQGAFAPVNIPSSLISN